MTYVVKAEGCNSIAGAFVADRTTSSLRMNNEMDKLPSRQVRARCQIQETERQDPSCDLTNFKERDRNILSEGRGEPKAYF